MTNRPSPSESSSQFERRRAARSIGASLIFNVLCPLLVYRMLRPHFPANSVMPLLYATILPALGLIWRLVRAHRIDVIAIFAMVSLAIHIGVTLVARDVRMALVARSLDGFLIGIIFISSVVAERPILQFVVRQALPADHPRRALIVAPQADQAFRTATLIWGLCLIALSGLHVLLALRLTPSSYLAVSPTLGIVTNLLLLAWTGRYVRRRIGQTGGSRSA